MSGRRSRRPADPAARADPTGQTGPPRAAPAHTVRELVRWSAFGCGLVPLVLVACGSSALWALAVTCGLAMATAACRALLLRSVRLRAVDGRQAPPPDGPRGGPRGGGTRPGGCHGRGRTTRR